MSYLFLILLLDFDTWYTLYGHLKFSDPVGYIMFQNDETLYRDVSNTTDSPLFPTLSVTDKSLCHHDIGYYYKNTYLLELCLLWMGIMTTVTFFYISILLLMLLPIVQRKILKTSNSRLKFLTNGILRRCLETDHLYFLFLLKFRMSPIHLRIFMVRVYRGA